MPEVTQQQKEEIYPKLLAYFDRKGCPADKAAEFAEETFKRANKNIAAGKKEDNVENHCLGIARNLVSEYRSSRNKYWEEHEGELFSGFFRRLSVERRQRLTQNGPIAERSDSGLAGRQHSSIPNGQDGPELTEEESNLAGEEYEEIRQKLILFFQHRCCHSAEELADETINRVARNIAEGEKIEAGDFVKYLFGVARNVLREYRRKRQPDPLDDLGKEPATDPQKDKAEIDAEEHDKYREECRRKCLQTLNAKQGSGNKEPRGLAVMPSKILADLLKNHLDDDFVDKSCHQALSDLSIETHSENTILISLYYSVKDKGKLAERLGLKKGALAQRIAEIKHKLQQCRDRCINNLRKKPDGSQLLQ